MLEDCWSTAVFAKASARSLWRRGTCSTHTVPAWANHALAIAIRWRSAGKCKAFLPWKASVTSSESPRIVADGRSDSATHWHAAANAVNSATLFDTDPRYPYPPKTPRPKGLTACTPKPADVAVSGEPLLREAPSNQTFTAVTQLPCKHHRGPPSDTVRKAQGVLGYMPDCIYDKVHGTYRGPSTR